MGPLTNFIAIGVMLTPDYNAVRIQTQKIKSWSIFYSPNYSAPPRITLRTELARYEAHTPSNRYEPLFATVYRSALIATCVFQCMIGHPHLNTAMLAQAGVGEYELRQEGKFVLREAQGTADMRIKSHPFVRELAGLIESYANHRNLPSFQKVNKIASRDVSPEYNTQMLQQNRQPPMRARMTNPSQLPHESRVPPNQMPISISPPPIVKAVTPPPPSFPPITLAAKYVGDKIIGQIAEALEWLNTFRDYLDLRKYCVQDRWSNESLIESFTQVDKNGESPFTEIIGTLLEILIGARAKASVLHFFGSSRTVQMEVNVLTLHMYLYKYLMRDSDAKDRTYHITKHMQNLDIANLSIDTKLTLFLVLTGDFCALESVRPYIDDQLQKQDELESNLKRSRREDRAAKLNIMERKKDLKTLQKEVDFCQVTYDAMVNEQNKDGEKSALELELKERLTSKEEEYKEAALENQKIIDALSKDTLSIQEMESLQFSLWDSMCKYKNKCLGWDRDLRTYWSFSTVAGIWILETKEVTGKKRSESLERWYWLNQPSELANILTQLLHPDEFDLRRNIESRLGWFERGFEYALQRKKEKISRHTRMSRRKTTQEKEEEDDENIDIDGQSGKSETISDKQSVSDEVISVASSTEGAQKSETLRPSTLSLIPPDTTFKQPGLRFIKGLRQVLLLLPQVLFKDTEVTDPRPKQKVKLWTQKLNSARYVEQFRILLLVLEEDIPSKCYKCTDQKLRKWKRDVSGDDIGTETGVIVTDTTADSAMARRLAKEEEYEESTATRRSNRNRSDAAISERDTKSGSEIVRRRFSLSDYAEDVDETVVTGLSWGILAGHLLDLTNMLGEAKTIAEMCNLPGWIDV